MILSDSAIIERLSLGGVELDGLIITPFNADDVQPSSVDLRLGPELKIATPDGFREWHLGDDGALRLHRPDFILAATLEWIEIPTDLVGVLVGKSSRAREGLCIEDAGYVDPGWKGNLTLEISNRCPMPVLLTLGMRIAQIRFEPLMGDCDRPYGSAGLGSHYQNSLGPVLSRAVVRLAP